MDAESVVHRTVKSKNYSQQQLFCYLVNTVIKYSFVTTPSIYGIEET